jgi:hypothetical protein
MGEIQYKKDEDPVKLKLLIDTGASHGLILDHKTDSCLYLPEKNVHTSLGRGLGGRLEGKLGRLESFSMGNYGWDEVIATFPETEYLTDSLMGSSVFRNGSVGGDIISRLKIIFNFPAEEIYVRKGKNYKKNFTYNLSGITIKAIGSQLDNYEIVEVQSNSSGYEVGFRPGDRLVSINNIQTNELPLGRIIAMLNSRPNKRLTIVVSRDGQEIKRSMVLESKI